MGCLWGKEVHGMYEGNYNRYAKYGPIEPLKPPPPVPPPNQMIQPLQQQQNLALMRQGPMMQYGAGQYGQAGYPPVVPMQGGMLYR